MPMSEILDKPLVRMPLLNEITHAFPKAITRFVDTPTQGLSLKLITPVALDFVSQAGMRNSTFRMSWNPFLDERKMIPMSVYDNLDVNITGIQHDSRFVPPDKLYNFGVVEILGTYGIIITNCSTKCMFMMLQFMVDLCCFDGRCVTHSITTKGPCCEFVTLVANTLSFAMSRTKLLGGGLFLMGCTMASPWEEFARQFCSHIHLMTTSSLRFKEEVIMNLVSLRWFYCPHVLPTSLEQVMLQLDFRPPAKPPDPYNRIEYDEFMVLHNQLLMLVFTIEAWLQVTEVMCNKLQQVLSPKQLGCTQPNNVRSMSSATYTTVHIVQVISIAVTACSKLKELDGSKYIYRYITVGLVAPYFLVKNTSIDMAATCGGINTIEGVFHNGLGMPIKPSVTFGRSTWTAPNLVCHAMFNSIAIDNIECEKANLFNNGLPSKSVLIFTDLEDKIIFRGDGNDMMHAVLFQCLLTKRLDNEINIDGIKVEVEQQGKAKHKKIIMRRKKRKKRDSGGHLEMSTTVWSSKFKQWDPGKICAKCNFYNLEDKVGFKGK
ncbi:hypothetical protein L195_g033235, partial [Trifolium pratense]